MLPDSYYTKMALGHRDVWTETWDILETDWNKITSTLESRGLWFMLAVVILMSISLAKVVVNAISCHKFKQYYKIKLEPSEISPYEPQDSQEAKMFVNESLQPHAHPTAKNEKIALSYQIVRNYLLQNDMTLNAHVIKSVRHNVSDDIVLEYMHTGAILKPYLTEYLDFDGNLRKPLLDVLKNKITSKKINGTPYLVVLNGEIEAIENELKSIFLNDNIKVKFDTHANESYN